MSEPGTVNNPIDLLSEDKPHSQANDAIEPGAQLFRSETKRPVSKNNPAALTHSRSQSPPSMSPQPRFISDEYILGPDTRKKKTPPDECGSLPHAPSKPTDSATPSLNLDRFHVPSPTVRSRDMALSAHFEMNIAHGAGGNRARELVSHGNGFTSAKELHAIEGIPRMKAQQPRRKTASSATYRSAGKARRARNSVGVRDTENSV